MFITERRLTMAEIDLSSTTKIKKSDERIKLEQISNAFMMLTGKDGCTTYHSNIIKMLCEQLNEVAKEI